MQILEKNKNNAFLRDMLDNEAQEQKEEMEKVNKHRKMCIKNLEDIGKQIEEKRSQRNDMNETEVKINARLLEEVYKR